MRAVLTAAGLAVALGDLWLVVSCWRSRSVLAGFPGAAGILIVLFAVVAGPARSHRQAALLIAAITLVVGVALLASADRSSGCSIASPTTTAEQAPDPSLPVSAEGRYGKCSSRAPATASSRLPTRAVLNNR